MSVFWISEHGREHVDQELEVLCTFGKVLGQVTNH